MLHQVLLPWCICKAGGPEGLSKGSPSGKSPPHSRPHDSDGDSCCRGNYPVLIMWHQAPVLLEGCRSWLLACRSLEGAQVGVPWCGAAQVPESCLPKVSPSTFEGFPPMGCIGTAPRHTIAAWACRSPSSLISGLLPLLLSLRPMLHHACLLDETRCTSSDTQVRLESDLDGR